MYSAEKAINPPYTLKQNKRSCFRFSFIKKKYKDLLRLLLFLLKIKLQGVFRVFLFLTEKFHIKEHIIWQKEWNNRHTMTKWFPAGSIILFIEDAILLPTTF